MRSLIVLLLVLFLIQNTESWAQDTLSRQVPVELARFVKHPGQKYGFYESFDKARKDEVSTFKSVGKYQADLVGFKVNPAKISSVDSVHFSIQGLKLNTLKITSSKCVIELPASAKDYEVVARYKNKVIGTLKVSILPVLEQQVRIVPLIKTQISRDSVEAELNRLFKPANVRFKVVVDPLYKNAEFDNELPFENPGSDRLKYTDQMRNIRDVYKHSNPDKVANTLLFFVIPEFVNKRLKGYMVKNKSLGFVIDQDSKELSASITEEYLHGFVSIEPAEEEIDNHLHLAFTEEEWTRINKNPGVYSLIDDYEDVVTNNGLIAYYLFEQSSDGTIVLKGNSFLASVLRPMKKNTYSYHLQIDNILFKTIFKIKSKRFNFLHLLSIVLSVAGFIYSFRKLRAFIRSKLKKPRFVSFLSRIFEWGGAVLVSIVLMNLVDLGYSWFEVRDGIIKSYAGLDEKKVIDHLFSNNHPARLEEKKIGSELIIKRKRNYYLYERKKVLYFKMNVSKENVPVKLRLVASSDSLKTDRLDAPLEAQSHYMVVKIYSEKGKWLRDQVYNHLGVDLTEKLKLEDPPKRILIFVNGYRPTSLGSTFEENFEDIRKNGLEFPNSLNRLFTEDRYNYWHPWQEIDDAFKNRINPTEFYYADGHHSVATSNHRSLLNFTTNSSAYPKRCKNYKSHTCFRTSTVGSRLFGSREAKTLSLLATKSNKKGFKIRENSGRIAGRNLYQMLNELPNTSKNDTLYIVAHSMGFAYAQGMVSQLRGKINFGAYYIIAPENGEAGTVNVREWNQVWQYGSNLHEKYPDAPCLQDGVAPQSAVTGLPKECRIFIPTVFYKRKGYFDSHFIGWYTWVLDIPSGQKGHIRQR